MWFLAEVLNAPDFPWAHYGLAGLVVGFVLLRDWHREKAQRKDFRELQKWIQDEMLDVIKACTAELRYRNDNSVEVHEERNGRKR